MEWQGHSGTSPNGKLKQFGACKAKNDDRIRQFLQAVQRQKNGEWRQVCSLLLFQNTSHTQQPVSSAFMGGGGDKWEESEENVENLRPFRENKLVVCHVFYFQTR